MAKRRSTYQAVETPRRQKVVAWLSCFGVLAVSTIVIAGSVALVMWIFAQVI